ncbi:MAG: type II secretion system F family protein [Actinomycetota bacterium]|nr:type II secretion system F family protein [Actinomycetota bacterium]
MAYVVAALVFVSVSTLVYSGLVGVFSEERQVSRRLRSMSEYESRQAQDAEPLLKPFNERILKPVGAATIGGARLIFPSAQREEIRRQLRIGGNPRGLDAERFYVVKLLAGLGLLGVFMGVSLVFPLSPMTWLLLVLPLVGLAFFAPDLWLSSVVRERQRKMRRALPDMLDMLTISVEAGLGFDAAIAKLIKTTSGPLAEEFGRMLQEVQAGGSRADALRHMADRTDVPELNTFIMAIVQAEVFGISVSSVLRTQAKEMRIRRRQHAEEQAQKAPVKLVFPLVLCILPATLIVILGPAAVRIAGIFG